LVKLVLWGQYGRLRDAALVEFGDAIGRTTLQVACAYGDLTNRVWTFADPAQKPEIQAAADCAGAAAGTPAFCGYLMRVTIEHWFALMHEQPDRCHELRPSEVFRAVKPGGTARTLRTRSVAQGDQSVVFPWLHTSDSQEIIFRAGLYQKVVIAR